MDGWMDGWMMTRFIEKSGNAVDSHKILVLVAICDAAVDSAAGELPPNERNDADLCVETGHLAPS